ncbi:MAG: glycosyltransferase family 39 protein [Anaerolineae bacterium]|nr:glycosyltransferase family 39 protein [Anaerolineae bacterium]
MPLRGHPLLVDGLNALPLYIGTPDLPVETMPGWGVDRGTFIWAVVERLGSFESTAIAGRIPTILFTLILAAVIYRWATDLWAADFGHVFVGNLALLLLSFDPTLLAHGRVATNDAGVTACGTLFLYLLWRWQRAPSWLRAAGAGCMAGLTMLAKGSGALWPAAGGILILWRIVEEARTKRQASNIKNQRIADGNSTNPPSTLHPPKSKILVLLGQSLIIGGTAFFVLWAMYGFTMGPIPELGTFGDTLLIPAPMHWRGVLFHTGDAEQHFVYALGQVKGGQWWWYFPLGFLIKNPLPLLIGIFFALGVLFSPIMRHRLQKRRLLRVVGVFAILYISVAITTGPNIGYRHILPLHPLFYLLVTGAVIGWSVENRRTANCELRIANCELRIANCESHPIAKLRNHPITHHASRITFCVLLAWYIIGTLRVFPYELTFFNELAGGPEQGWRYLAASNTDWRQSWKALHDWQQKNHIVFYDPGFKSDRVAQEYKIDYIPIPTNIYGNNVIRPPYYPEPGDYVIRAHNLSLYSVPYAKNYTWFQNHTPDAIIANSLYYYHVPVPISPTWLAQCTIPSTPLNEQAIVEGFGDLPLRQIPFDCTQTWIYPHAGGTTGWYALHGALLQPPALLQRLYLRPSLPESSFIRRHLTDIPQSARQWEDYNSPAFALYEWSPSGGEQERSVKDITPEILAGYSAAAGTPPTSLETGTLIDTPVILDGPLAFQGISTYCEEESLEIETWWQVSSSSPITRSFSLMAHLLTHDNAVLGVADGLGIPGVILQTDDVIVQRHHFSLSSSEQTLWLRTGAYWLDNNTRWNITGTPTNDAIFVPIRCQ